MVKETGRNFHSRDDSRVAGSGETRQKLTRRSLVSQQQAALQGGARE